LEQIELSIDVHGEFNKQEQEELAKFFATKIIGRDADYETLVTEFCKERYYFAVFGKKAGQISIYK
jgi:hypothetical protein